MRQLRGVKVTVVGEWMSDVFDMWVQSQQGAVQTRRCVNTGQSNLVWLITVFNQVKFTSVHASGKRNPTAAPHLHHRPQLWRDGLGRVYVYGPLVQMVQT